MEVSRKGQIEILSHEAIVTSPYYDSVGVLTVFAGHTAAAGSPDPKTLPFGVEQPISLAFEVFSKDIKKYSKRVDKAFKGVRRPQHVHDGATSFDYNTGGILRASWVRHWLAGNMVASRRAFLSWNKPSEIIGRRKKEAALVFSGHYSGTTVSVFPADKRGRVQWGKGKRVNVERYLDDTPDDGVVILPPDDPMADGLLILGERGAAVAQLVADMKNLGFWEGKVQNVYTSEVKEAVQRMQRAFKLRPDGVAGPRTFEAISKALEDSPRTPETLSWVTALINFLYKLLRGRF